MNTVCGVTPRSVSDTAFRLTSSDSVDVSLLSRLRDQSLTLQKGMYLRFRRMRLLHDKVLHRNDLLLIVRRETFFTQRRAKVNILLDYSTHLSVDSVIAALMKPDFADEREGAIFQKPAGVFCRAADFAKDRVFRDS